MENEKCFPRGRPAASTASIGNPAARRRATERNLFAPTKRPTPAKPIASDKAVDATNTAKVQTAEANLSGRTNDKKKRKTGSAAESDRQLREAALRHVKLTVRLYELYCNNIVA